FPRKCALRSDLSSSVSRGRDAVSRCEAAASDELSVAIEESDFERNFRALEHARGSAPCSFGDDVPEPKIVLHGILKRFRCRIGRENRLAQSGWRAGFPRKRGECAQVYRAAFRVQVEKALRELCHLRHAARDGDPREWMRAQIFQRPADE